MTAPAPAVEDKRKDDKRKKDDDPATVNPVTVSAPFHVGITRGTGPAYPARIAADAPRAGVGADPASSGLSRADRAQATVDGETRPVLEGPAEGPTVVSTAKTVIPGVDATLEHDDPYAAATVYEAYAGKLLQAAQRDDVALGHDRRFALADLAVVEGDEIDYRKALEAGTKGEKRRAALEAKYGLDPADGSSVVALSEYRESIRETVDRSDRTLAIADSSIPLIDGTYEETKRVKTETKERTGGRSRTHAMERFSAMKNETGQIKHSTRLAQSTKATKEVRTVGGHVREAKLSADQLSVKVKQFQQFRQHVSDQGRSLNTKGAKAKRAVKGIGGKVIGAATGGIFRPELRNTDGGHSGELDLKHGFIWNRVKAEIAALEAVEDSKAYGRATGFHVTLQSFMLILRELRDFFGGLTIWLSVASVFAPVVVPFATLAGLLVVGLAAVRAVIGAVLLSWTLVQRAVNSNYRNNNLLKAQSIQQGTELAGDVAQVVAPTATAATGNAAGLVGGYTSTVQQLQTQGGFSNLTEQGAHAAAGIGTQIGNEVATKTVSIGTGAAAPGIASAATNYVHPENDERMRAIHQGQHAAATPVNARTPAPGAGGPQRVVEPQWLKDSRTSETASLDKVTDALVTRHAGKLREFHGKTQVLVRDAWAASAKAGAADAASSKVPEMATPENSGRLAEGGEALGGMARVGGNTAEAARRFSDPQELRRSMLAELQGAD